MVRLVVFDLDGTLVDSRQDLTDSANAMLATYGAPPLSVDAVAGMVGDGVRQLVDRALQATGLRVDLTSALDRFIALYDERLLAHTRLYPGVPEALRALSARATLSVLTNKPEGASRRILTGLDVESHFKAVIGGDSGFPRKPDPAGLLSLVATAGASREETVYVGDSMVDVETARRAGTRVIVAQWGFGRLRRPIEVIPGELRAETPRDLPDLCDRALGSPPPPPTPPPTPT